MPSGPWGTLYTLQFEDRTQTELDAFLGAQIVQRHKEFPDLSTVLANIPTDGIPSGHYIKTEGYEKHGWVAPLKQARFGKQLRLYCIRPERSRIVIAGGGGVKRGPGKIKRYPVLDGIFKRVCYAEARIHQRVDDGSIRIVGTKLVGNLRFEREED